jgi:MFS family permease
MADIWDPNTRGKAFSIFTLAPFAGPAIAPLVSGFIGVSEISWRWLYWVTAMCAGVCVILILFTLPETHK